MLYNKEELKDKHEEIRKILIDNGNKEYGGLPPTTVYYEE